MRWENDSVKYLSLCLPTNGVSEWVFPVIEAIYNQDADVNEFEVVITDNGNNIEFQKKIQHYVDKYSNLKYSQNNSFQFGNQIEALKLAQGQYLKFLNHRAIMEPGALSWMINLIKENVAEKPVIYMSNGTIMHEKRKEYNNFSSFLIGLGRYITWTTGVGVWKSDFEKIPSAHIYNYIDPHSDVLLWERNKTKYIIDDKKWSHEIDDDQTKKGKYDLYRCFAVEEPSIILNLLLNRDITEKTYKLVIRDYEKCVSHFFCQFNLLRTPCSYDIKNFNDSMGIFMNKYKILFYAYLELPKALLAKLYGSLIKKKR